MRPGALSRLLVGVLAGLLVTGMAASQTPGGRHEDAVPSAIPPGFKPMDVSAEVEQIRARETAKMAGDVDADIYYRRVTGEDRMRARYGSSTWNMYGGRAWH